jgi:membrane-associated phospholipid phosphatase
MTAVAVSGACGQPASKETRRPGAVGLPADGAPPLPGSSPAALQPPRESEPSAGQWIPILLTSADAIVVPPPPGEQQTAAEVLKLRQFASQRSDEVRRIVAYWDAGGVRRWNEVARNLAARNHLTSSAASRLFALLAVAQVDALIATWHYKYKYRRPSPATRAGEPPLPVRTETFSYPSEHAAVAAVSSEVLTYLVPGEAEFLKRNAVIHANSRLFAGTHYSSDNEAGYKIGVAVAAAAIEWGDKDGSHKANDGAVREVPGSWYSTNQNFPSWGKVKPWLARSGKDLRAPQPPKVDSPEFRAALAEIRTFSDSLTAEQMDIALYWNLGVGAISVPGMWDRFGLDMAEGRSFSEPRTARMLAYANMAMMDAGIASWETKYHYLVPRPWHVDPKIQMPLGLPAHPSYTSGHSAFSGAAAAVLGYVLPDKAAELNAMAEQASESRWYGGIHYRFDGDEGLKQGRAAAALAIARARTDGCP